MLCFFTSGRVLGKQQKSPSSKPHHFCIIISLEKLASCFQPLSRRASLSPRDAFTLTVSWAGGSISLRWDHWPQRASGLAHALATRSAMGTCPFSLVPGKTSPAAPLWWLWSKGCQLFVGCWDGAFPLHRRGRCCPCELERTNTAAVYCLVFQGKPSVHSETQGISTIFLTIPVPPAPAFGHTHCVVLT